MTYKRRKMTEEKVASQVVIGDRVEVTKDVVGTVTGIERRPAEVVLIVLGRRWRFGIYRTVTTHPRDRDLYN